jgi:hypothetical protein
MREFAGVAGDNALMGFILFTFGNDLVEDGYDKDCRLTHTRFGLTENILAL